MFFVIFQAKTRDYIEREIALTKLCLYMYLNWPKLKTSYFICLKICFVSIHVVVKFAHAKFKEQVFRLLFKNRPVILENNCILLSPMKL